MEELITTLRSTDRTTEKLKGISGGILEGVIISTILVERDGRQPHYEAVTFDRKPNLTFKGTEERRAIKVDWSFTNPEGLHQEAVDFYVKDGYEIVD